MSAGEDFLILHQSNKTHANNMLVSSFFVKQYQDHWN